jgi:hypothetical protein
MVAMAAAVDYGQWLVDDDSGKAGIKAVGRKGPGVWLSCGIMRSLTRRKRLVAGSTMCLRSEM